MSLLIFKIYILTLMSTFYYFISFKYLICKFICIYVLCPKRRYKKDPAFEAGSCKANHSPTGRVQGLRILPSALLMAIGFQALAALVIVHLETAFLFEVTHLKYR